MRKNYYGASNRAQSSGGNFEDRDRAKQPGHSSRQWTFGEMSFQPFDVTAPIHNFINARLKKENGEKRRDKNLQQICCSRECVQAWHPTTPRPTTLSCRSCISPAKKTGTRFLSAPLFRRTILGFLSLLWAYDRVVSEVQIVRSSAIEVDPTLDDIAVSRTDTHRQRGRTVGRHGHTRRDGYPVIASAQGPSIVNAGDSSPERIRGELRRRDAERLVAARGVE